MEDLSAGYGKRSILRSVSFTFSHPGTLVGLLGANAAGKSTLLKSLAGLIQAEGKIRLGKQDLPALPHHERMRHLSYVPQTALASSSLLVYEYVLSACRIGEGIADREARIEAVFSGLHLSPLAFRRLSELSGGQRQLVSLALALIRHSRLLLLDEPTSALDLHWQMKALQHIRRHLNTHGAIGIMAIHDINLAIRFCDELLILHGGELRAKGKPEETVTASLLRQVYGIQARLERDSSNQLYVIPEQAIDGDSS